MERTKKVSLSLNKIDTKMSHYHLNDKALSKKLEKNGTWFNGKRHKAEDGTIRVYEEDALKMGKIFNCNIQEITADYETFQEPLMIDYRQKAFSVLDDIMERESQKISAILEIYQRLNSDERDFFQGLLEDLSLRRKTTDEYHEDWWKYLVVADLMETVLDAAPATDFSDIKKRFLDAIQKQDESRKEKAISGNSGDSKMKSNKTRFDRQVDEMQKILSDEWDKITRKFIADPELDSSLRRSAFMLVSYIMEGRESHIADLIKHGKWRIALTLRYYRD